MASALRSPLDIVLGATGRVRALRVIQRSQHGARAVDVARQGRLTIAGAQRAIAPLVSAGLVTQVVHGRGALYQWNEAHPFAGPLAALFDVERERYSAIFGAVEGWVDETCPRPLAVWWYGSTARGTDTFDSDVDIAVVGPDDREATHGLAASLSVALEPIKARFAVYPSIVAFTAADIRDWPAGEAVMWENLTRDAVALYGRAPEQLRAAVSE